LIVQLKVILKVSEFSSSASSLMKINEPRKLTSLQDPSGASSHGRIYAFNHIYVPGDPVVKMFSHYIYFLIMRCQQIN